MLKTPRFSEPLGDLGLLGTHHLQLNRLNKGLVLLKLTRVKVEKWIISGPHAPYPLQKYIENKEFENCEPLPYKIWSEDKILLAIAL